MLRRLHLIVVDLHRCRRMADRVLRSNRSWSEASEETSISVHSESVEELSDTSDHPLSASELTSDTLSSLATMPDQLPASTMLLSFQPEYVEAQARRCSSAYSPDRHSLIHGRKGCPELGLQLPSRAFVG